MQNRFHSPYAERESWSGFIWKRQFETNRWGIFNSKLKGKGERKRHERPLFIR